MPAYTPPSPDEILEYSGFSEVIEGTSLNTLKNRLGSMRVHAENRARLVVGEAVWSAASLTEPQAEALAEGVALLTMVRYLRRIQTQKLTGTHEPLLME